jgi:BirA family biotin operon repressor/biotin-[acetyl-CoA-carboxylase] ligase
MSFDPARFDEIRAARGFRLGQVAEFRAVTGSTNDDALKGAREGAPHGALYVAGRQTAGRGRRGNRWFGAEGQSVAFTVLLRPNVPAARVSGVALVGGLAVRRAVDGWLRAAGRSEQPLVKWPNDVVIGGRKLCGILAESQIRGSEVLAIALGVGLNLGIDGLPSEIAETATSLRAIGVAPLPPEIVIAEVLEALEARIDAFSAGGESTVEELRQYDALVGKRVRVGQEEGLARGINRSGSLLLQSTQGVVKEVQGGHVEVLSG